MTGKVLDMAKGCSSCQDQWIPAVIPSYIPHCKLLMALNWKPGLGKTLKAIFGPKAETEAGPITYTDPMCQEFLIYCTDKCFGQSRDVRLEQDGRIPCSTFS